MCFLSNYLCPEASSVLGKLTESLAPLYLSLPLSPSLSLSPSLWRLGLVSGITDPFSVDVLDVHDVLGVIWHLVAGNI